MENEKTAQEWNRVTQRRDWDELRPDPSGFTILQRWAMERKEQENDSDQ